MIPLNVAIFSYPLVALVLFRVLSLRNALIWTILLGYLFLPTRYRFNLPVLPAIDKNTIPAIAAILCLLVFFSQKAARQGEHVLPGVLPRDRILQVVLLMVVCGGFLTVLTNTDTVRSGSVVMPGLSLYSGFSSALSSIMVLLPLLLARKYLASEEAHRDLLKALALSGLLYSSPIIYELVMSPQLNRHVYGFFPHDWRQHLRGGSYRPLVFLNHGLWLAIFMAMAMLSAFVYARVAQSHRGLFFLISGWLVLILASLNSLGALVIGLLLLPAILLLGVRLQLIAASVIAASLLCYPLLRQVDLIPTEQIATFFEQFGEQRANSLRFRFINEDILLDRARERPLFGWGGFDRSRVFTETGRKAVVTDGFWVIQIGQKGWVGYIGLFGLLCLPMLFMALRHRKYQVTLATSGLSLVLAANMVDMIPNATLTPVTLLVAGALLGRLEWRSNPEKKSMNTKVPLRPRVVYSRFEPDWHRPTSRRGNTQRSA